MEIEIAMKKWNDKEKDKLEKTKSYLERNLECEFILNDCRNCSSICLKVDKKNTECSLSLKGEYENNEPVNFTKLNKSQLKGFIAARNATSSEELKEYFSSIDMTNWPNKGKLVDFEKELNCLVKMAYESRDKKIVMKNYTPKKLVTFIQESKQPLVKNILFNNDKCVADTIKNYMSCSNKLEICCKLVDSEELLKMHYESKISSKIHLEMAEKTCKLLEIRLNELVNSKVDEKNKFNWCWSFVTNNIVPLSIMMVVNEHLSNKDKIDIAILNKHVCLLEKPSSNKFIHLNSNTEHLEGVYLFFDRVSGKWIRSGKTCRRCFSIQMKEHRKCAEDGLEKNFYASYSVGVLGKKGKYEWLDAYVGWGWSSSNKFIRETNLSDFWDWKSMKKCLSKRNKDQEEKLKLNAIAYLVETGYDLLLSSHCNVSESPGFENFLFQ